MTELAAASALATAALTQEELFPIREVSRLTGVNPVTLRAWERRYGLIQPTRTDSACAGRGRWPRGFRICTARGLL